MNLDRFSQGLPDLQDVLPVTYCRTVVEKFILEKRFTVLMVFMWYMTSVYVILSTKTPAVA